MAVIRGLRYPVQMLLGLLASGMSIEEGLADYPDLERDDFLAASVSQCARAKTVRPRGR
ncbi:MAG: DUF433 domain-containing protein [Actinomycetes bacterium]